MRAVRAITNSDYRSPTASLFSKLEILDIFQVNTRDITKFMLRLACSRLPDSRARGIEKARTRKKKNGRKLGRGGGGGACNHFFKRPVPVYQLLVYSLIGQIWQVISTLSKRVVPVTILSLRKMACGVHSREINEATITSTLNECLKDFPHIESLRKEQKPCLVNLARGKDVLQSCRPGLAKAWYFSCIHVWRKPFTHKKGQ